MTKDTLETAKYLEEKNPKGSRRNRINKYNL